MATFPDRRRKYKSSELNEDEQIAIFEDSNEDGGWEFKVPFCYRTSFSRVGYCEECDCAGIDDVTYFYRAYT